MHIPQRAIRSLQVSAIGLGCMGMTTSYHRSDPREALLTLQYAVESGITLFDTAAAYGAGRNERFVGAALKPHRDRVAIATKCGIRRIPPGIPIGLDGSPGAIRKELRASLQRLGVDHIDLYYLHRIDPKVPVEESVGAMAEAVQQGLVREIGLSEATADQLRRAHAIHPIAALESEWSLFARDIEKTILPVARELGVAIVPFSPLGRGMLTATEQGSKKLGILDYRRTLPWWRKENIDANLAAVSQIRAIADSLGVTTAQVALAWVVQRGDDVIPIPGTAKRKHLQSNIGAFTVELSDEHLQILESIRPQGERFGSTDQRIGFPRE
ncbi:MAG: aldo/keto reductase [Actinomycetaceae bacterium]|nr:aldo/keto reductase [Actinomycetaceae bacterium]